MITDASGAVTGVLGSHFGETVAVKARSVVIAAGGFVMNPEMVACYTPKPAEKPFVLDNSYDDGLGTRLGMSVGGATKHLDQAFITAPVYPPAILLTGIIVNKLGARFVAEDSYHSRTSGFVMDQPDSAAYLIVDEAHLRNPQVPLVPLIDGEVLRPDGTAIPGLYAVGRARPTSPRTARATSAAPNSVRGRSSAAAAGRTPPVAEQSPLSSRRWPVAAEAGPAAPNVR